MHNVANVGGKYQLKSLSYQVASPISEGCDKNEGFRQKRSVAHGKERRAGTLNVNVPGIVRFSCDLHILCS